jgi:hypothetical protein
VLVEVVARCVVGCHGEFDTRELVLCDVVIGINLKEGQYLAVWPCMQ